MQTNNTAQSYPQPHVTHEATQNNTVTEHATTPTNPDGIAQQAANAPSMREPSIQNALNNIRPGHNTPASIRRFDINDFFNKVSDESQFSQAMVELHQHLNDSDTDVRKETISALAEKQAQLGEKVFVQRYHFRFPEKESLMAGGIEFKSVFSSEEWSKVMVEGIRESADAIEDKDIVDVGCGNFCFGTVARKLGAKSAAGLDINADAILNAKINQILLFGHETDTVDTSDLLTTHIESGNKVDTIIACIPQIVNFNASAESLDIEKISKSSIADRERHSHQTAPAGGEYAEYDIYGLGLVARLLKQAPDALAANGKILLNVAGRPGTAVIDKLFTDFGFVATPKATKAFKQQTTGDDRVDLSSWTQLEDKHKITFEFYKDEACQQKLTAQTAQNVLNDGEPVYHTLTCYLLTRPS